MSCHLSHRLTTVHRSVSMALLYSVGYAAAFMSHAQAATIGKTVITSAQHEPLAASIMITDIKTADFSASLANSTIYQQMGLTPTDSMTVRFQPTSATSGHVLITTTKPVSKPFADVVLSINDGTQRNVIPKTLLMPLNNSLPITPTQNIVTGAKKPNLPEVSTTNAQPLIVKKGTPPPLLLAPTAVITPATQSTTRVYSPNSLENSRLDNERLNNDADKQSNPTMTAVHHANNHATGNLDGSASATGLTDNQFDILNIQITRQIQPNVSNNTSNANNTNMMAATPTPITPLPTAKNSSDGADLYSTTPSTQIASQQTLSSGNLSTLGSNDKDASITSANNDTSSEFNYTVQRNDNLWIIAQQIAEKNNLDVQTVMNEIQTQNPNAFINKNADQLKADAQLSLPKYDVVPSQKKLQAAISEQRKPNRKANTPIVKKPAAAKAASKIKTESAKVTKRTEKPVIKKTQTLPTAQFSVLAPGHDGSADGTKTKAGMATGNGLSTDVLDILKSSRQSTADQAQRLSKTNSTLGSYTKKLQLQNQKLAELQARLEKLRNQ